MVSRNTNALRDTLENYDAVKEFFKVENEAVIVAATMRYFGVDTVNSLSTENKIPKNLQKSSNEEKRKWLHGHIKSILDEYVMDGVSDIERRRDEMGMSESDQCFPADFLVAHEHLSMPNAVSTMKKKIHDLEVAGEKQGEANDETKRSGL